MTTSAADHITPLLETDGYSDDLDSLDSQIISMLLHRVELEQRRQKRRRAEGLTVRELARENATLGVYVAHLGKHGGQLASLVLALSQVRLQAARPINGAVSGLK